MSSTPRAAVDIGSNSVRLLVQDASGADRARDLTITRLAAAVDRTGALDDEAVARTLDVLASYRDRWRALGVHDRVRIAATSAVRDADDRDRFLAAAREVTGVEVEVLSGDAEAALAYAGAIGAVEVPSPAAVVDIGGGSTELIVGANPGGDGHEGNTAAGSVSLQLGSVRVTERHLHADPPTDAQIAGARVLITEQLRTGDDRLVTAGVSTPGQVAALVAVAGTATTLGALHLHLDDHDRERVHGVQLPAGAVAELADRLLAMTTAQRGVLGPVAPGREDVIHAGALILAEVVARYGFDEVVVSEADGLDALAASLG